MKKRITIATIFGLLFGMVCCALASKHGSLPTVIALSIVTGRTLIGFSIGISRLKLHWAFHGLLFGIIFSIPGALGAMSVPNADMTANMLFVATVGSGAIYGLLIEFFTTVVFKAKR